MSFKVKHMIFGKIAIILCLCLVLNNTFMIKSYADESIATQNPLFIPISTLVATVAVGSGIIAKNSADAIQAGNQLVNNVVNNIKSSEIQKSQADENYDSPYRVINGGQPEKPNNSNKNGKWVALGGGAIASNEIWANKEAVKDVMQKINAENGYKKYYNSLNTVDVSEFYSSTSASNISLQLAKISNSCVTQFDEFLHCNFWDNVDFTYDDCCFLVNVDLSYVYSSNPRYPTLSIRMFKKDDRIKYVKVLNDVLDYGIYSNSYGSNSHWYSNKTNVATYQLQDVNNVSLIVPQYRISCIYRNADANFKWQRANGTQNYSDLNTAYFTPQLGLISGSQYAYNGYVYKQFTPFEFTQNVYNVEQNFDVNFPDWLQESINLLNQNIAAVRLGIQSLNNPWDNTQTEVQSGTTPASIIYQFINNYENPENIPEEEEEPDKPVVVPPAIEEPQPTNDYLGNFLLPESITTKFPFCIPFDIARALRLFSVSQREAPKWECDLNYGSNTYHVVIDLAMFNDVASFIRPLEFILFLVGLALGTRSLIRG